MTKEQITEKIVEIDKQRQELVERLNVLNRPNAKEINAWSTKRKALFAKIKQTAKKKSFTDADLVITVGYDLEWANDEYDLPTDIECYINYFRATGKSLSAKIINAYVAETSFNDCADFIYEIEHKLTKQLQDHYTMLVNMIGEYSKLSRTV